MDILKECILREGKSLPGGLLKVDSFLNHQLNPRLMKAVAEEFAQRFADTSFNKVLTIEASGIAPALMVGVLLDLPVVFIKKKKPHTMEQAFTTQVFSFTKQQTSDLSLSREFLSAADRVLFIDDFLACGNAALAVLSLIEQAGASLVGMGFVIEKAFQHGSQQLRERGIRVESLAIIESLENCQIHLRP